MPDDPNRRRAELAAIHVAKKQLRLDDDTYRGLVRRVSAKFRRDPVDSSGLMNARERAALIEEMRNFGFRRVEPRRAPAPGGPQEAKIRALWKALEESGALDDPSDKALRSFIKRQTGGVEIPQWLTAEQANKVIEGLEAWHRRKAEGKSGCGATIGGTSPVID